jgi:transposase-like protein
MRVLADGRVRRTEAEWGAVVERYEKSGQTISEFCRRVKLSRNSFTKWRRRLAATPSASPSFVEWIASPAAETELAETSAQGVGEFELSLPGGVVLRWKA